MKRSHIMLSNDSRKYNGFEGNCSWHLDSQNTTTRICQHFSNPSNNAPEKFQVFDLYDVNGIIPDILRNSNIYKTKSQKTTIYPHSENYFTINNIENNSDEQYSTIASDLESLLYVDKNENKTRILVSENVNEDKSNKEREAEAGKEGVKRIFHNSAFPGSVRQYRLHMIKACFLVIVMIVISMSACRLIIRVFSRYVYDDKDDRA
ncbi:unnamed protein product [Gordionus sp. m RMFG-2023]